MMRVTQLDPDKYPYPAAILTGSFEQVSGVAAAPHSSSAAAASSSADGSVNLWTAGIDLRRLSTLRGHTGAVHSIAWLLDQPGPLSASQVLADSTLTLN